MEDEDIAPNTYLLLIQCVYGQKVAPVHYILVYCTGRTFCPYPLDQLYVCGAKSSDLPFCVLLYINLCSYLLFVSVAGFRVKQRRENYSIFCNESKTNEIHIELNWFTPHGTDKGVWPGLCRNLLGITSSPPWNYYKIIFFKLLNKPDGTDHRWRSCI